MSSPSSPGSSRSSSSSTAQQAVSLKAVEKVFGAGRAEAVTALTGVDLDVAPGEFVSLIGPSGCGKSTLLRLVADLEPATAGAVTVFGKPARQARLDQDYGIAFQSAGLLPWRTVRANIALPLELRKVPRARRLERADELLDMIGLAEFAGSRPHQLSGGMQQRVAIARALAEQPRLLLMDEPFGALDEMTRERMQGELLGLSERTGCAVVFVTHSIPEAVYLSDRVVVMSPRPGRITEIVPVSLGERTRRGEDTREDASFFAAVTAVREALRGSRSRSDAEQAMPDAQPKGVESR